MKVLFVRDEPRFKGGAERFLDRIQSHLIQLGFSIFYTGLKEPVHLLGPAPNRIWINPNVVRHVKDVVLQVKPDVIHINTNNFFTNSILQVFKKIDIPLIHSVHDWYLIERLQRKIYLDRHLPFHYITPSAGLAHALQQMNKPVTHLPIGVDVQFWTYKPYFSGNRDIDLLFVGRLERTKGIWMLCALYDVLQKIKPGLKLTLVGEGTECSKLMAWKTRRAYGAEVELAGVQHDAGLLHFYHRSKLLVFPSLIPEGLGYVGLEAQAAGTPVVAFQNAGTDLWCMHQKTGFAVEQGNFNALLTQILTLLDHPDYGASVTEPARAWVEKHFNINTLQETIQSVFQPTYVEV